MERINQQDREKSEKCMRWIPGQSSNKDAAVREMMAALGEAREQGRRDDPIAGACTYSERMLELEDACTMLRSLVRDAFAEGHREKALSEGVEEEWRNSQTKKVLDV